MVRYLPTILMVTSVALFSLCIGCGGKNNAGKNIVCLVGSDTLSVQRVNQLAPDSLIASDKIARVALELILIYGARMDTPAPGDSTAAKRIAKEFADQLSRQSPDAWSVEAAGHLYKAVKAAQVVCARVHSCTALIAYIDSLAEKTITGDSAHKAILMRIKQPIPGCNALSGADSLPYIISRLFILPLSIAKLACEFAASAETPTPAAPAPNAVVQGLVFDSTHQQKSSIKNMHQPHGATVVTGQDNAQAALKARTQSSIKDSIVKHIPDLEVLYKKFLKVHQNMAGTIVATFRIQPDGAVASARIATTKITEKEFLAPLHNYFLKEIHFKPIPEKFGMMEVEFPFEFTPDN